MKSLSVASLALAAVPAQAALRFACSTLSIQRLDPIVQPGSNPAAHLHQIVGGNAFQANMTGDIGEKGTCTTCVFSEDFSNYWTAVMFFKSSNGTYKKVPIVANDALPAGTQGGMTVYYTQETFSSNGAAKITSFKPGFRMTVGSPSASSSSGHTGLRFVCLKKASGGKSTRFPELADFPKEKCDAGIMTVHHFPACWDGKNLDSPNHQDHMYNTVKDAFQKSGPCPTTHPVRVAQVSYETIWDTTSFNSLWKAGDPNPFTLSYGDNSGYGTHADYLFGWKGDALQRAMDSSCMFNACEGGRPLKSQSVAAMNACKVQDFVKEDVDSWLQHLPGRDASGMAMGGGMS